MPSLAVYHQPKVIKSEDCAETMDKFEDMMLDLAWRRFEECWNDKREVETKASILLTANGVLLGLLVNGIKLLNPLLAGIGVLSILGSSVACVMTLKLREFRAFDIRKSWEYFKKTRTNLEQTKLNMFGTLAEMERINRDNLAEAAKWLSWAVKTFLVAIGAVVVAFIISLISY